MKEIIPIKVKEGDLVGVPAAPAKPSCGGKAGWWYCATHVEAFGNQFEKDGHISRRKKACALAWICPEHGLEVP